MKVASIFRDNTVLQANKPIRIFGSGAGRAEATFDGETQTVCSSGGSWCLTFSPRPYGGPYELSLSLNGERTVYTDIYVGEVLLLAGQSNIAFKLHRTTYPKENYEENSKLRYFVARRFADEDAFAPEDGWVLCTKDNAAHFSALGYHVGMEMSKQKGVAVGLIACYLGSSVIESWIPAEIGKQERFYLPQEEKYDSPYVRGPHNEYGMLYRTRQQSIVPFSIGRVIWYQGESNTGKSEWKNYTELLSELIGCWRRDFMDADLPFTVVQIADWDARRNDAWKGIQRAQERIAEVLEHVTVIRSADVCETFDIHPPTKIHLAMRILDSTM